MQALGRGVKGVPEHTIAGRLLRIEDTRNGGHPLSAADLGAQFSIFFAAGVDTTGHTIAWTLCVASYSPSKLAPFFFSHFIPFPLFVGHVSTRWSGEYGEPPMWEILPSVCPSLFTESRGHLRQL